MCFHLNKIIQQIPLSISLKINTLRVSFYAKYTCLNIY